MSNSDLKVCTNCQRSKPLTEFHKRNVSADCRDTKCKECKREAVYASREANPVSYERRRAERLWSLYRIRPEQFDAQLELQGNGCAICHEDLSHDPLAEEARRAHVDHDHDTGANRGILCPPCNLMLGNARDRPDVLRRAADYLEAPPWRT